MKKSAYYEALLDGIDGGQRVERIVHGVSWTAAVLSGGGTGVAMHTEGETVPRRFAGLEGLPARQAAEAVLSWNMEEASEGQAVINAFYNTPERAARLCPGESAGALDGLTLDGLTVGFVGHLPGHSGISEELLSRAGQVYILEREPRPGDYPDPACEYLLPDCDLAVITGSASINKTLPRLLELCENIPVILTGPSVSLCPALLKFGIRRLHGIVFHEPEEMLARIVEKRRSVNAFGSSFCFE